MWKFSLAHGCASLNNSWNSKIKGEILELEKFLKHILKGKRQ